MMKVIMDDGIGNRIDRLLDKKVALHRLQVEIAEDTSMLVRELVKKDMINMLSINWSRLNRLTCTEPLRSRMMK